MNKNYQKIGLSLSGGGYRAAAFHLGTLKKLHELNLLDKVDIISTISGGSIIGAYYCLNKNDYSTFEKKLYEALQYKNVIKKIWLSISFLKLVLFILVFLIPSCYVLFTNFAWLAPIIVIVFIGILLRFQFQIFPISREIEKIYNTFFYEDKKLQDLPDKPILVIGSTNLQTGRTFTFSKTWMQDSTYQYTKPPIAFKAAEFPIARAVMASSCVPFAFVPIKIDKVYFKDDADARKVHPLLVDGGVYDNQGIHKIVQQGSYNCDVIITSDAGGKPSEEMTLRNTFSLLLATVDVFMDRIKKSQLVQDVYRNVETTNKQVAYFSLGWKVENCLSGFVSNLSKKQIPQTVIDALQLKEIWVADPKTHKQDIIEYLKNRTGYAHLNIPSDTELQIAQNVGTNLTALSKQQVDCLMKQAEAMTELQIKLYCPSIIAIES
tara:strand:- start:44014 stop:45318 length:1305 start_codon:yes stop_codon:yes gene_type:complete